MIAPPLLPNTSADSAPNASSRAATSSARSSGVESCSGSSSTLPEIPRGSWVTTVWSAAIASARAANGSAPMGAPDDQQQWPIAAHLVVEAAAGDIEGVGVVVDRHGGGDRGGRPISSAAARLVAAAPAATR